MLKVKIIKSSFGFDVGKIYDAILSEDKDGYIVLNDTFKGFAFKSDVELIK